MPGEITLGCHGCLFIDEISELPKNVLEALRQPLEDKLVHISRVGGNDVFPAKTMLIAAMNKRTLVPIQVNDRVRVKVA